MIAICVNTSKILVIALIPIARGKCLALTYKLLEDAIITDFKNSSYLIHVVKNIDLFS